MLTYKQFNKVAKRDKHGGVKFDIVVDFNELAGNCVGIGYLNSLVDTFVHRGYLLEDLSYQPIKLSADEIIVQVHAGNVKEFDREHNA